MIKADTVREGSRIWGPQNAETETIKSWQHHTIRSKGAFATESLWQNLLRQCQEVNGINWLHSDFCFAFEHKAREDKLIMKVCWQICKFSKRAEIVLSEFREFFANLSKTSYLRFLNDQIESERLPVVDYDPQVQSERIDKFDWNSSKI